MLYFFKPFSNLKETLHMQPYEPHAEAAMRTLYLTLDEKQRRHYAGVEAIKFGRGGRIYIARVLGCSRNTVTKGACEMSDLSKREVQEQIGEKASCFSLAILELMLKLPYLACHTATELSGRYLLVPHPESVNHFLSIIKNAEKTAKKIAKKKPRIRRSGGGRKSSVKKELDQAFLKILREHTAGNPMDESVIWTDLTINQIIILLWNTAYIRVSAWTVRKLLKKHGYRRLQAQKRLTMKSGIENRDAQFKNIMKLRTSYEAAGNPVISMDTKKKEAIGNFYRDGRIYTQEVIEAYDHDFKDGFSEGTIIPHSIYDLKNNEGYIQLGTSHDTSEFACDSLRYWWENYGRVLYPQATSILVLCDGGGSNSSRHYIFKQDLQQLAEEIGVEIRIAHYPPYCSKYNPIEHRFFPHVTRACQGVIFSSVELVKQLMEKTHTKTGLKAFVHVIDKAYETGRKVAADFKETMRIVFDEFLPSWNYCAIPTH
jgi:hypothetical protein